ncbi:MAG: hypothetical protein Q4G24_10715 [Paracoccus sp. (in: a-proteobacteria)]|uniref:hypothetical protein n=1 Tax=Paracoccus sp. TaxID=267 RepID=UPI0026DEEE9F|nr:hypothetical protein [Paracoccus sp. (in: a-proteobacteria)]MDO5621930.1 hypothetical protein [Paracoccus sp. (in: a-proteobacteria)]
MTVVRDVDAGAARLAAEAARLARVLDAAAVPEGCGPDIPAAPARGPARAFQPVRMVPDGSAAGWRADAVGFRGLSAVQALDVFDDLERRAKRAGKPVPFTPGQVAMGRRYRDLVERHDAGGMRCASLEVRAGVGPSAGGEFMDAFVSEGDEIRRLRARIGTGVAMVVRRVRPSARGAGARVISDRVLVDSVCLAGLSLRQVLQVHGWSSRGLHTQRLCVALAGALDRMQGYGRKV